MVGIIRLLFACTFLLAPLYNFAAFSQDPWTQARSLFDQRRYEDADLLLDSIFNRPTLNRYDSLNHARSITAKYIVLIKLNEYDKLSRYIKDTWPKVKHYTSGHDSKSLQHRVKGYYHIALYQIAVGNTAESVLFLDSAANLYAKTGDFKRLYNVKRIAFLQKAKMQSVAQTRRDWSVSKKYFTESDSLYQFNLALSVSTFHDKLYEKHIEIGKQLLAESVREHNGSGALYLHINIALSYIKLAAYTNAIEHIRTSLDYLDVQNPEDQKYLYAYRCITQLDSLIQSDYSQADVKPLMASIIEPAVTSGNWGIELRNQTKELVEAQMIKLEAYQLQEMLGDKYLTIYVIVIAFAVLLFWLAYANYQKETELRRIALDAQAIYDEMSRDRPFDPGNHDFDDGFLRDY